MQLDKNGDSEGNFSVLALREVPKNESLVIKNFTCNFQMVPVAQFQQGVDRDSPVSEFSTFCFQIN